MTRHLKRYAEYASAELGLLMMLTAHLLCLQVLLLCHLCPSLLLPFRVLHQQKLP
jgi:hypothetical protein